LRQISDMPIGFYSLGDCDFNAPCVSIVGSRNCTAYGQIVARKFAMAFTRAGITVVSGMARGIDSAAHFGAIEAGGKTIAVLGCGADIIYPSENIDLYKKIIEHGAIVSEFPLGTRADRQTFPIRNRIVAGMSLATIVVESDVRGGSLITARLAGEQGRDVFAVPGRIDSDSSKGCNALIRDGATLASCPEDIIDSLSFSGQLEISLDDNLEASTNKKTVVKNHTETKKESCDAINLQGNEAKIYSAIAKSQEISADEISEKSGLPVSTCLSTLLMLEIKRLIVKNAGGSWSRRC